jgi:uncharacterized protein
MHSPLPTVDVRHAVMHMHWDDLTFLHWAYDPDIIQALLPEGLTVDIYEGRGWISLVPFVMRVIVPGDRYRLPFIGRFPETNVRTYVREADGTQGIWFFSLDAGSALATLGGRAGYRLPYMWSDMSVERNADTIEYHCHRKFPGPKGASSRVHVGIGDAYEPSDLDHWLSARWRLYSVMFGRLWGAHAVHEQWPLQHATLLQCDDDLMTAAGLPRPTGDPIVQFAERVTVRIGRPYTLAGDGR